MTSSQPHPATYYPHEPIATTPAGLRVPRWMLPIVGDDSAGGDCGSGGSGGDCGSGGAGENADASLRVPTSSQESLAQLRRASSTIAEPLRSPAMSAVLVLISGSFGEQTLPTDASVVLMHRATTLRKHAGQMSFPGGRMDPDDQGPIHTALREAEEETGLDCHSVTTLRVLDAIDISRTGFAVHPVLAYWHAPHPLRAVDPAETDEVLQVPIRDLINPDNRLQVGYGSWSGPAFRVKDYIVWGFTGGVLHHLLHIAGWAVPWNDSTIHGLRETLMASANGEAFGLEGKLQ